MMAARSVVSKYSTSLRPQSCGGWMGGVGWGGVVGVGNAVRLKFSGRGWVWVTQLSPFVNSVSPPAPNVSAGQSKPQKSPPRGGMLSYCTCAQAAGSTKLRKKIGLSVAYKTIGTFLSQEGHTDATGLSSNMHNEAIGCSGTLFTTAKQQLLDLLCRHVTEFTYNREPRPPLPPGAMPQANRCTGSSRGVNWESTGKS